MDVFASHFSTLDCRDRSSRSMLFCFFNSCIFRTRSAKESFRLIVKSSESLVEGGRGGFRSVYDSSTCVNSGSMIVCRRLGNDTLISADGKDSAIDSAPDSILSSKSGVEVHEIGRFFRGAATVKGEFYDET